MFVQMSDRFTPFYKTSLLLTAVGNRLRLFMESWHFLHIEAGTAERLRFTSLLFFLLGMFSPLRKTQSQQSFIRRHTHKKEMKSKTEAQTLGTGDAGSERYCECGTRVCITYRHNDILVLSQRINYCMEFRRRLYWKLNQKGRLIWNSRIKGWETLCRIKGEGKCFSIVFCWAYMNS